MTPKEKASKLVVTFMSYTCDCYYYEDAKACALILVEEILESQACYPSEVDWDDCGATHQHYYEAQREEADKYWQEVKQEIEKIA